MRKMTQNNHKKEPLLFIRPDKTYTGPKVSHAPPPPLLSFPEDRRARAGLARRVEPFERQHRYIKKGDIKETILQGSSRNIVIIKVVSPPA